MLVLFQWLRQPIRYYVLFNDMVDNENTLLLFVDDPFVSDVYVSRTGIPQGVECQEKRCFLSEGRDR
jgi:hypothetical protein